MAYETAALVGIAAAVVTVVLWVVIRVMLPVAFQFADARVSGSGGFGFVSVDSVELFLVAVVGFAAGFAWKLRRSRKSGPGRPPTLDRP